MSAATGFPDLSSPPHHLSQLRCLLVGQVRFGMDITIRRPVVHRHHLGHRNPEEPIVTAWRTALPEGERA